MLEEEYLNGWKRAKADLINYQKDEAKRFEDVVRFSNAVIIKDLLAVLDSFASFEKNLAQPKQDAVGFLAIQSQMQDILKNHGLEKIKVTVGENFNPQFHESVGEAESELPVGVIVEEVTGGYLLNGLVIRPTKVKLSKSK
ncbi:MAG: Protein GrpE [Parcubacteria group bacterium GW2011_GWA2_47_8b]|uniref:Protein GrpE n=2 Tax=Parcubacteria group TaxID=1794811 RepID=A0A0G1VFP4_9BACT|nr:MAG: Protein GrpE [Candidatus Giovannonibacteria bacterium GW2011_GWB1_47_6b]KKU84754.1 MAG: Protein GrpE [Parcubacteria group bacterium GW2011_GWA2_47_8b]KKU85592.1 MAG: Protein GrpE [Parcubacteria group bacterium GW2011_GWA1_47_9]OGY63802.1 MAG: nucleotide exchange factor GrpE [Candidatus Harrisonbacteria bacterium RIFCSPHIGHO2_12_FULL_48_16]